MPIERMDHFTVVTKDAIATAEFCSSVLGLEPGPRPNFSFPGVWLYSEGRPLLHVMEKDEIPSGPGVLDHMAFWATDLRSFLARLNQRGIAYDLRRVPDGGPAAGVWQLFFRDPNGARVEIDLAATEPAPPEAEYTT
jgi:catechol 2,3-dioxygenase-like lactoylglutathione lyase family enzyme